MLGAQLTNCPDVPCDHAIIGNLDESSLWPFRPTEYGNGANGQRTKAFTGTIVPFKFFDVYMM